MSDVIIRNVEIYDGSEKDPYNADIIIAGDKIKDIGYFHKVNVELEIQGDRLCLMPGFIDSHTHSDVELLRHSDRKEALKQGITTEIIGSCGIATAPLPKENGDYLKTVAGIYGDIGEIRAIESLSEYRRSVGWSATNYAIQLAHSPARILAVGFHDVKMTSQRKGELEKIIRNGFEQGACAFSTGLSYYPASYSDTDELVDICRIVEEYKSPFTVHLRSVQNKFFEKGINPLKEAIEVSERSGVHLHFSHYRTRANSFGQAELLVQPIEEGIARGMKITADFYPYPVGAGYIAVYLPLWVMNGSMEEIMSRLENPMLKKKIMEDMTNNHKNLSDGVFIHAPKHPEYLGKTYTQVAEENHETVSEMLVRFLYEEELNGGYTPKSDFKESDLELFEKDCATLLKKSYYMVGSDTLPGHKNAHPRTYHTFHKLFSIAHKHNIPLQLVANRISAKPAEVFGLMNRGRIEKDMYADLVLFDKKQMKEQGILDIKYLFINGVLCLEQGALKNVYAGRGLKHNQS